MNTAYHSRTVSAEAQQRLFVRVFSWMFAGLSLTAIISFLLSADPGVVYYLASNPILFWGLIIVKLGLVWFLSGRIDRLAVNTATFLFFLYAALNGITLTLILAAYAPGVIITTFFVTAGMFGACALFGYLTKMDMSRFGGIFLMALIGILLATLVNLFLKSDGLYWAITYIGVFIFAGLTAYEVWKLKQVDAESIDGTDAGTKVAIYGALGLYLSFINMFLFLLRIFGRD